MEATWCQVIDVWQPQTGNNVLISPGCVRCVAYVILRLIENVYDVESCNVRGYFSSALNVSYTSCLDYFSSQNNSCGRLTFHIVVCAEQLLLSLFGNFIPLNVAV